MSCVTIQKSHAGSLALISTIKPGSYGIVTPYSIEINSNETCMQEFVISENYEDQEVI